MKTVEEKIAETVYLVEADEFSQLKLWDKHHTELNWKEDFSGFWQVIGYIDNRPICISITWAIINNHRVAFWEGTSQLVDYLMIEDWLQKHFIPDWKEGRCRGKCNALNFHLCLQALKKSPQ